MNGCGLILPTRTQTSGQEYNDLTVSIRRPSRQHSRNIPQSFSRRTRSYAFSRSTKPPAGHFGILPRFLEFSGERKFSLCCYGRDEKPTACPPLWFNYFAACCFKAFGIYFSRETKETDALVVSAFSPVTLFLYADYHPVCQSFATLPEHQALTMTYTSQPKKSSIQSFEQFKSHFIATCSLHCFDS